jgi:NTP pyrophosphatase (non-canonical NTP hydrolase)
MSKLNLKHSPTFTDIQKYVEEMEKKRSLDGKTVLQKCLMLGEEIEELFKAIRKSEKMQIDLNSKFGSINEELADIIIFLCSIANDYGIDLEQAIRDKEKINDKRQWKAV